MDQLTPLEKQLRSVGAKVSEVACESLDENKVESEKIDLIIFNHAHETDLCSGIKKVLVGRYSERLVPVFALVKDDAKDIQKALSYGAADYITDTENIDSIIQKIQAVFSEENVFSSSSAIDITPTEAVLTATGIRVFVIEDDPLLRNLLTIRLENSSFPCDFSEDGIGVVPELKKFKPNVIILDLMLPGISGFDVLTDIMAEETLKGVPVIVFSNRDGADDRQRAKELGAAHFFVKAMTDLSELIKTIEDLVKK